MKTLPFFKYQATGNDFVIIDQFKVKDIVSLETDLIQHLCDRKFGIGADGLMLLSPSTSASFKMTYYNSDGLEGSLCGNGSRCAISCMYQQGHFPSVGFFEASDGMHEGKVLTNDWIELKMNDRPFFEKSNGFYLIDTGSPHYVSFVEDLSDLDIVESGRAIRYSNRFREFGVNVNFVEEHPEFIEVGTYERGVENETLSCGTGVTAAALAHAYRHQLSSGTTRIKTKGGELEVRFKKNGEVYSDIWLCGPAKKVFEGSFDLSQD